MRQDNAFMLRKGNINLTSGVKNYKPHKSKLIYLCIEPGQLRVTWGDNTTDDVDCVRGTAFTFERTQSDITSAKTIEILSGKFHLGV